jgi:hypothetical protein
MCALVGARLTAFVCLRFLSITQPNYMGPGTLLVRGSDIFQVWVDAMHWPFGSFRARDSIVYSDTA